MFYSRPMAVKRGRIPHSSCSRFNIYENNTILKMLETAVSVKRFVNLSNILHIAELCIVVPLSNVFFICGPSITKTEHPFPI